MAWKRPPLRAPSVFNFYRPGYVPPGTAAATRNLAAPEMQIVHETTAAGYVNYIRDTISSGRPSTPPDALISASASSMPFL